MRKILLIDAHPRKDSFCGSLAGKYVEGSEKAGNSVETFVLRDVEWGPLLYHQHEELPQLPESLLGAQGMISEAHHLVFAYPTWWAAPPAMMKLFIEAVFLPGFAYRYKKSKGFAPAWDKFLTGKSAELLVTMDSPSWYYRICAGNPGGKMMNDILHFCGVTPVKSRYFGSVKMSSPEKKAKWLEKAYRYGLSV